MVTGKLARLRTLATRTPAPPRVEEAAPPPALTKRFAESVLNLPTWMLQATGAGFSAGGTGFSTATGTPTDRRGGRDLALYSSEIDLRGYRILSRHITDTNPFGKGFAKLLVNYHVRKGYGWQACRKGAHKAAYQTDAGPQDPLVAKAQSILDAFRDKAKWPLVSREAFRRAVRDGEVIGRWFHGGNGRLPEFRFAEPDALGSPTGDTFGDGSFGILTPKDDPAGQPEEYHFFGSDGTGGEWVPADRVVFYKRNTDSGVKRGLPDFFPVANELESCTQLVRSMLASAIRQAKTAWIEKFPGRAQMQVTGGVPEFAASTGFSGQARAPFDGAAPWWLLPQIGGGVNPWEPPGVVRKVEGDREYEPGPTSTGVPGYVQVEQAALRGCGVIWSFPEYFSGDASNANMASTFAAGTPFTVEVESNQYEFGACWERPSALKVLELARDAGLLSWEEWRQLDVEVTEPAVVIADPGKDTDVLTKQLQAKIVSLDTARQKLGYDPQHEAEGVKKDAASQQPPDGGDGDGGLGALLGGPQPVPAGESRAVREADADPTEDEIAAASRGSAASVEPWQMSADEYAKQHAGEFDSRGGSIDASKAKRHHAQLVMNRVLDGDEVPAERISEYPHLDLGAMQALAKRTADANTQARDNRANVRQAGRAAKDKLRAEINRDQTERQSHDEQASQQTLRQYLDGRFSPATVDKIMSAQLSAGGRRIDAETGSTVGVVGGEQYRRHYRAVKNMLEQGKAVPPEVLADYPDLAAKYGKK